MTIRQRLTPAVRARFAAGLVAGLMAAVTGLAPGGAARAAPPAPDGATTNANPILTITNLHSNRCIGPENGTPNALIRQRGCNRSSTQLWEFVPTGSEYLLVNRGTGYCLDLQANSEDEVVWGTLAQQFWCNGAYDSEYWYLVLVSYPYYQLVNRVKNLCLDVRGRSSSDGALLQVWGCKSGEPAQLFRLG
jgi:hypothetical protein